MVKKNLFAGMLISVAPVCMGSAEWVDAGSSRSVWMHAPSAALTGNVFNVSGSPLVSWSKVRGPGTVNFTPTNALATSATFSDDGIYELKLIVDTGTTSLWDRVVVTVYETSQTFGYSAGELESYFTGDLGLSYDVDGLSGSRLKPPPAPYVHPRILFNPEDLPDLRSRLTTTELGQILVSRFRTTLDDELHSGNYAVAYTDLVNGDASTWSALSDKDKMMADIVYECFLALIDDNSAKGADAAAALATACAQVHSDIQAVMPTTDYRNHIQTLIHRQYIGLAYDFIYPYMTEAQRTTVRQTLALATSGMWNIGMDALPAPFANTSNWVPTHLMHLLFNTLAIEGETGYDADLYPRIVAAYERFLRFGVNPDGSTFEGLGKNSILAEMLIPMAKRGDLLVASMPARNHIQSFYAHTMVPWGDKFIWDEEWGGVSESRYVDVPALKYAFPDDPVIDTVYRNDLQQNYARLNDFNRRFPYKAMDFLMRAVFAEDYNHTLSREESFEVLEELPLDFFSNEQGLMIARSDWTEDAIHLHFRPRSVIGGHSHHDRNGFSLNALGRVWCPDRGVHFVDAKYHSLVFIDGESSRETPAKVVEYKSSPGSAVMAGDSFYSWGKEISRTSSYTAPADCTYNFFRLNPGTEPWADLAYNDLPQWESSYRSGSTWRDYHPVQRAFRTAGLVRGDQPFCLIVDDIQKDDNTHLYEWRLQIEEDLGVVISGNDVVLSDPSSNRRLLVRLLDAAGSPVIQARQIPDETGGSKVLKVVSIETTAVAPGFKVMLLPYMQGDALPQTSLEDDLLTVSFADGSGRYIEFQPDEHGRNRISVSSEPPSFSVSPLYVSSSGEEGEVVNPLQHSFYILNATSNNLPYSVGSDQPWVELNTGSGILPMLGSNEVVATIFPDPDWPGGSDYTAELEFTSATHTQECRVTVNILVPSTVPAEEFSGVAAGDVVDLEGQQLTFIPHGSRYITRVNPISELPVSTDGATAWATPADDGFWTLTPAWSNAPSFYGSAIPTIYVGSNGQITFDSGSSDYSQSAAEHFAQRMISLLWEDMMPNTGGTIHFSHVPGDRAAITFTEVPLYVNQTLKNTVQLEIFDDGSDILRLSYLKVGALDAMVGLSSGTQPPWPDAEMDFSARRADAYLAWRCDHGVAAHPADSDADGNGLPLLIEYALHGTPEGAEDAYQLDPSLPGIVLDQAPPSDVLLGIEWNSDLLSGEWRTDGVTNTATACWVEPGTNDNMFFRLKASQ